MLNQQTGRPYSISSLKVRSHDAHELTVHCASPTRPSAISVVILGEIFGLTPYLKEVCRRYAESGISAYAPCLYNRLNGREAFSYAEEKKAHEAATKLLSIDTAVMDIEATIKMASSSKTVGMIGFSYGATLGWIAAARLPGIKYFCGYYGNRIALHLSSLPSAPYDLLFCKDDVGLTAERLKALQTSIPPQHLHFVEAGHGFDCNERPSDYSPSVSTWAFNFVCSRLKKIAED